MSNLNLILILFVGLVSIDLVVESVKYTFNVEENFEDETLGLLKENCLQHQKFEVAQYKESNFKSPFKFNDHFASGIGSRCSQTESIEVTSDSEVSVLFSSISNFETTNSFLIEIFNAENSNMIIKEEIQINNQINWTWMSWTLEEDSVIKIRLTFKSSDDTSYLAIDKLIIKMKDSSCLISKAAPESESIIKVESNTIGDAVEEWKVISVVAVSIAAVAFAITVVVSVLVITRNKKVKENTVLENDVYPVTQTIIPRVGPQRYH